MKKKKKGKKFINGAPVFITDREVKFIPNKDISQEDKSGYWGDRIKKMKKWSTTFDKLMTDKIEIEITIKVK